MKESKSKDVALTTIDNPYSPFSKFDDWYSYDTEKGYDCCGYIDRMKNLMKEDTLYLSSENENQIIEKAINEIVNNDPTGYYIKVEKVESNNENGKDYKLATTQE